MAITVYDLLKSMPVIFQLTVVQVLADKGALATSVETPFFTSTLNLTTALARVENTLAVMIWRSAVNGILGASKNTPPHGSCPAGLRIFSALPVPPAGPATTSGNAPP